jgi:hypothetical protein
MISDDNEQTVQSIRDVLAKGTPYVGVVSGLSMYPMLRPGKDTIVVSPIETHGSVRKGDVILFLAPSHSVIGFAPKDQSTTTDSMYVLHRIVQVGPSGYITRGDHCTTSEMVQDGSVLGVLAKFYRGERQIPVDSNIYRLYVSLWNASYGVRMLYFKIRGKLGRIYHALRRREKGTRGNV